MDSFGASELRRLIEVRTGPCVSIFLPTHAASEQGQQDTVRLKNLLQHAEQQLADGWMRAVESRNLLQPARNLLEDRDFWDSRSHGLAVFLAPGVFQSYRLPRPFDEFATVRQRFHVKPVLPLVTDGHQFFVLALSQNRIRLLLVSKYSVENVEVPGLPTNLDEALNYAGADRGAQVHSAMHGSFGKQAAVFHGQGGRPETRKDELAQFFRLIDAALRPVLRDQSRPLLLAGVGYLLPIFREISSYSHLASPQLDGNCDYLTDHQLHQRVWPLMEPTFERVRVEDAAKYRQLAGTGKTADDIRQIVPAAQAGRIGTLFVDIHALQWGLFDAPTGSVQLHEQAYPGDDDLLDLAAAETLLHRGTVYSVEPDEVPGGQSAAAMYRY